MSENLPTSCPQCYQREGKRGAVQLLETAADNDEGRWQFLCTSCGTKWAVWPGKWPGRVKANAHE